MATCLHGNHERLGGAVAELLYAREGQSVPCRNMAWFSCAGYLGDMPPTLLHKGVHRWRHDKHMKTWLIFRILANATLEFFCTRGGPNLCCAFQLI